MNVCLVEVYLILHLFKCLQHVIVLIFVDLDFFSMPFVLSNQVEPGG